MNFHHGTEASRARRCRALALPGRTGSPFACIHPGDPEVTFPSRHTRASRSPRRLPSQTVVQAQPLCSPNIPEPTKTSTKRHISPNPKMPKYCDLTGDKPSIFKPISHDQGRQLLGLAPKIKSHIDLRVDDDDQVAADAASVSRTYGMNHPSPRPRLYELHPPRRSLDPLHTFGDSIHVPGTYDPITGYSQRPPTRPVHAPPGVPFREVDWTRGLTRRRKVQQAQDGLYSPRWTPERSTRPSLDPRSQSLNSQAPLYTSMPVAESPDLYQPHESPQSHADMQTHGPQAVSSDRWTDTGDGNANARERASQLLDSTQYPTPYARRPNLVLPNHKTGYTPPVCGNLGTNGSILGTDMFQSDSPPRSERPIPPTAPFPTSTPAGSVQQRIGDYTRSGRITKPTPRSQTSEQRRGWRRIPDQRFPVLNYGSAEEEETARRRAQIERRDGQ